AVGKGSPGPARTPREGAASATARGSPPASSRPGATAGAEPPPPSERQSGERSFRPTHREGAGDLADVAAPVLDRHRQRALLQVRDRRLQRQLPDALALRHEQRGEVGAGLVAVDLEVGHDGEALQIDARVVVVSTDEDAAQLGVAAGDGVGQRQRRAVVVAGPAVTAFLRSLRVVIQVERTAEVDPSDEGTAVLVAERLDLAFLDRLGWRHDAADVIDVEAMGELL